MFSYYFMKHYSDAYQIKSFDEFIKLLRKWSMWLYIYEKSKEQLQEDQPIDSAWNHWQDHQSRSKSQIGGWGNKYQCVNMQSYFEGISRIRQGRQEEN